MSVNTQFIRTLFKNGNIHFKFSVLHLHTVNPEIRVLVVIVRLCRARARRVRSGVIVMTLQRRHESFIDQFRHKQERTRAHHRGIGLEMDTICAAHVINTRHTSTTYTTRRAGRRWHTHTLQHKNTATSNWTRFKSANKIYIFPFCWRIPFFLFLSRVSSLLFSAGRCHC